jgi:alpha-amylase
MDLTTDRTVTELNAELLFRTRFLVLVLLTLVLLVGCAGAPEPGIDPADLASIKAAPVSVTPQEDWDDAVIYFVILDRFADGDPTNNEKNDPDPGSVGSFHGGDLLGLTANLDEIAALGATCLWITPVQQQIPGYVSGAGFFDWGYHGYWADDFYAIDPRFGTEAQLKDLVDQAHERGMKVLLDVVYNHCGYDSRYIFEKGRPWLRFGSHCGNDDLTGCLSGLPDFKTENPEVREYLLEAHLGLAERTGVDGFRLDTVKHVEHDFWQLHRERSRARLGEDFFLLGEVWGGDNKVMDPWFAPDEMDAGFDFGFQGSAVGFLLGRGRPIAYNRYLEKREEVRAGHFVSHYLSSHDTDGALYTLQGDRELFRLAVGLQMTAAGIPCIYYGEEVARLGGTWPDNRSDMPWGDRAILPGQGLERDEGMRAWYQKLIGLRRAHPALRRGERKGVDFGQDHLIFHRHDPTSGEHLLVAVNRGDGKAQSTLTLPENWPTGPVTDLLMGQVFQPASGTLALEIPARGMLILAATP